MTQVPASSHGGVSAPVELDGSAAGSPVLTLVNAVGQTQAIAKFLDSAQGSGTFINADGSVWIEPSGHDQAGHVVGSDLLILDASSLDVGATFTGKFVNALLPSGVTAFAVPNGGGIDANPIPSGALPTVAPVSATAFQCSTTRDVFLTVPVTYNPGVATTATCKVELSPDNVTFSELVTITQPVGTVFDGSIEAVQLVVPAAWRVKLTVTNATLGTGTYY